MDDVLVMQRYVGLAFCGAISGIKGSIPLFELLTKPDDRDVAMLKMCFDSYRVHFGRLVIPPKRALFRSQQIAGRVACFMVGNGRSKCDGQIAGLRPVDQLLTPI